MNFFGEHMKTQEEQYINYYECPRCKHKWVDVWAAICEDDCPECGLRHIEPYKSEDIIHKDKHD